MSKDRQDDFSDSAYNGASGSRHKPASPPAPQENRQPLSNSNIGRSVYSQPAARSPKSASGTPRSRVPTGRPDALHTTPARLVPDSRRGPAGLATDDMDFIRSNAEGLGVAVAPPPSGPVPQSPHIPEQLWRQQQAYGGHANWQDGKGLYSGDGSHRSSAGQREQQYGRFIEPPTPDGPDLVSSQRKLGKPVEQRQKIGC